MFEYGAGPMSNELRIISLLYGRGLKRQTNGKCDHGRWLEPNVGQQYRKGPDRLLRLNDWLKRESCPKFCYQASIEKEFYSKNMVLQNLKITNSL